MGYHKFCPWAGKNAVRSHSVYICVGFGKIPALIEPLLREISGLEDISMLTVCQPLKYHDKEMLKAMLLIP